MPDLDLRLRSRLRRRFGPEVEPWLDALPPVLTGLAERWDVELGSIIQRGSVSVVIRCRTAEGLPAVLKVSPDRERILAEAAALARWTTAHVPAVHAVDDDIGALLIEAIEPGTALDEMSAYPSTPGLAELVRSLHETGRPDPAYRPLAERVAYLFESGARLYEWKPDLVGLVSRESYARARERALELAAGSARSVLLHGDLTPVNILDGGERRGLVAIDPAPCIGDPAFDAIDLVLWRARDADTIVRRVDELAPAIGAEPDRLFAWCAAFAGMTALEIAEASDRSDARLEQLLALASRI